MEGGMTAGRARLTLGSLFLGMVSVGPFRERHQSRTETVTSPLHSAIIALLMCEVYLSVLAFQRQGPSDVAVSVLIAGMPRNATRSASLVGMYGKRTI